MERELSNYEKKAKSVGEKNHLIILSYFTKVKTNKEHHYYLFEGNLLMSELFCPKSNLLKFEPP